MIVPWTVSTMLAKAGYRDAYRVLFPNPLTHPGFTYPCYNPLADIQKLTWAPLSDERERIDLIYYQGRNMRATDAKSSDLIRVWHVVSPKKTRGTTPISHQKAFGLPTIAACS